MQNIGQQIQQILDEDFISLRELADKVGLAWQGLQKIIDGKTTNVRRSTIRQIAEGTDRDFRIDGEDIYFIKRKPVVDETTDPELAKLKVIYDALPGERERRILLKIVQAYANSVEED